MSFGVGDPFRRALVQYRPTAAYRAVAETDVRTVRGVDTRYAHAALDDLTPGTRYHYRVLLDGAVGADATFRTAPDPAEPLTFTAFGDEGVDAPARALIGPIAPPESAWRLPGGGGRAVAPQPRLTAVSGSSGERGPRHGPNRRSGAAEPSTRSAGPPTNEPMEIR